jgi:hypothetical protein
MGTHVCGILHYGDVCWGCYNVIVAVVLFVVDDNVIVYFNIVTVVVIELAVSVFFTVFWGYLTWPNACLY